MFAKIKQWRGPLWFVAILYAVELLDDLIYGLHGAVLPFLKNDFALTYAQVGLLSTFPALIALTGEPIVGLLGDTRYRRALAGDSGRHRRRDRFAGGDVAAGDRAGGVNQRRTMKAQ
jgi:MFS family permease